MWNACLYLIMTVCIPVSVCINLLDYFVSAHFQLTSGFNFVQAFSRIKTSNNNIENQQKKTGSAMYFVCILQK
jgi:hypothetical protein